jgi:hypothetical protein
MTEQQAADAKLADMNASPLEKAVSALKATASMGTLMFQALQQAPKAFQGQDAYTAAIGNRAYIPEDPRALEYMGDVGNMLERLETEYKIPPIMPELLPFQSLAGIASSQAAKGVGQGAARAGMAAERALDKPVTDIMNRGGRGAEMLGSFSTNPAQVVKPKGGNWQVGSIEKSVSPLRNKVATENIANYTPEQVQQMQESGRLTRNDAINNWVDRNLTNYLKNEMATPQDPIRLLLDRRRPEIDAKFAKDQERAQRMADRAAAETDPRRQANLSRQSQQMLEEAEFERDTALSKMFPVVPEDVNYEVEPSTLALRTLQGFPEQGMATNPEAKAFENIADEIIFERKAKDYQQASQSKKSWSDLSDQFFARLDELREEAIKKYIDVGETPATARAAVQKMSHQDLANVMGDENFLKLKKQTTEAAEKLNSYYDKVIEENPYIEKVDPETSIYKLNKAGVVSLNFDHVIDVLKQDLAEGRITPEQLSKVSIEQAIKRVQEYDIGMAKKMRDAQIKQTEGFPVYKDYGDEGYKWIELTAPKLSDVLPEGWSEPVAKGNTLQTVSSDGKIVLGDDIPNLIKNIYKRHPETPGNPEKVLEDALKYEGDTMGHCVGGYCPDVISGKSRIYSLRDKRGEPHVTIETTPGEITPLDLPKDLYEEYRSHMAEGISAHGGRPGATEWLKHFHPDIAKQIIPPESIRQIKGKGNARPVNKYDPYTQDFVRSAEWSKVGDLNNTGLRDIQARPKLAEYLKNKGVETSRYLPEEEYLKYEDDYLMDRLYPRDDVPPVEGMKRGGRVHISDNPDTMMMELEDRKFAGGGLLRKAAKIAMRDSDALIPSARGASKFAEPTPKVMDVVKEKGGNWLKGSVESSTKPLKLKHEDGGREVEPAQRLEELKKLTPEFIAERERVFPRFGQAARDEIQQLEPKTALNNWIDQKLNKYIKNEMGTPEDPIRALAEQGITHLPPNTRLPPNYSAVQATRREAGFPEEGVAQSDLAKVWEGWADKPINFATTGEAMNVGKGEPWMEKVDPFTKVYGIAPNWSRHIHSDLGFDHVIDVLKEDLATGRITPDQLSKITMEQAVRRTSDYNQQLAKKMAEARNLSRQDLPVLKEYPEGYRWVELNKPGAFASESDAMGHSVRGYEPPKGHPDWNEEAGESGYSDYGFGGWHAIKSGKVKVYSLVDKKNNPHVTIEVAENDDPYNANGSSFVDLPTQTRLQYQEIIRQWRRNNPDVEYLTDADINQALKESGVKPINPPEIHQIKGKQNAAPNPEYLPFVRDFQRTTGNRIESDWQNSGFDWKATGPRGIFAEDEVASLKEMGHDVPDYLTTDEKEQLIRRLYEKDTGNDYDTGKPLTPPFEEPPIEGMKAGGKVHISDNPDSMMMEMEDQKFAVGGAAIKRVLKITDHAERAAKAQELLVQMAASGQVNADAQRALLKAQSGARSLPTVLPRAASKTKDEIRAYAQRTADQLNAAQQGKFLRASPTGASKNIAGKSKKQWEMEQGLTHDIRPLGKPLDPIKTANIEDQLNMLKMGITGDTTISDQMLHRAGQYALQSPSEQQGGAFFGLRKRLDPAAWASNIPVLENVQRDVGEFSRAYGDVPVIGQYNSMGSKGTNFAQHFADANLEAIASQGMTPDQVEQVNNLIRKGNKKSGVHADFPGVEDPSAAYFYFSFYPELRKHFNDIMTKPDVTSKLGLPDGRVILHAITDPELRDMPVLTSGRAQYQLVPDQDPKNLPLSEHSTYTHNLPRKPDAPITQTPFPVPAELEFSDVTEYATPRYKPSEMTRVMQTAAPRQIVDQQHIDEIKTFEDFMRQYSPQSEKKKAGGLIKVKRKLKRK